MKIQVEVNLVASLLMVEIMRENRMVAYQRRIRRRKMPVKVHPVVSLMVEKVVVETLVKMVMMRIMMKEQMEVYLSVIILLKVLLVLT
jgi:hypothetical protein